MPFNRLVLSSLESKWLPSGCSDSLPLWNICSIRNISMDWQISWLTVRPLLWCRLKECPLLNCLHCSQASRPQSHDHLYHSLKVTKLCATNVEYQTDKLKYINLMPRVHWSKKAAIETSNLDDYGSFKNSPSFNLSIQCRYMIFGKHDVFETTIKSYHTQLGYKNLGYIKIYL